MIRKQFLLAEYRWKEIKFILWKISDYKAKLITMKNCTFQVKPRSNFTSLTFIIISVFLLLLCVTVGGNTLDSVIVNATNLNHSDQKVDNTTAEPISIDDNSLPEEEQATQVKLKVCDGAPVSFSIGYRSVKLPTFYVEGGLYHYILGNYDLRPDNVLYSCGDDSILSVNTTTSISIQAFNEQDLAPRFKIQRLATLLLDNGYLAVGLAGNVADYYALNEFCLNDIHGHEENLVVDYKTCSRSRKRPVIKKCCPIGTFLPKCEGGQGAVEPWDPDFFSADTMKEVSVSRVNPYFRYSLLGCKDKPNSWEEDNCTIKFHPVTDNRVAFIGAYRHWEYIDSDAPFCLDRLALPDGSYRKMLIICNTNGSDISSDNKYRTSYAYMISMYLGAFFHMLTAAVYMITWPKQNIHGRTLCSCTLAFFLMKFFLGNAHLMGIIHIETRGPLCIANAVGAQYFMIGAFAWLLVVNIDLWWTFRSIRADGSKSWKRFLVYSSLGWGFPLLVSGISLALDLTFRCRTSAIPVPEFGERYCFVIPWAQGYYVYYILSVLIALSFGFAFVTLYGLYSFKKDSNNLRSNKRTEDKQTALLFLKLSVVMGLNWVFEVISWAATKEEGENHIAWVILDIYNALSAILIFVIFVCKKTTLNLLEQTHPMFKGITAIVTKFTRTFTRESSSMDNTLSTGAANTAPLPSASHQIRIKKSFDKVAYSKNGQENRSYEN